MENFTAIKRFLNKNAWEATGEVECKEFEECFVIDFKDVTGVEFDITVYVDIMAKSIEIYEIFELNRIDNVGSRGKEIIDDTLKAKLLIQMEKEALEFQDMEVTKLMQK